MVRWLLQSSSQGPWCGRLLFLASPGLDLGIGPDTLSSVLLGVDGCTQWGCALGFLPPCCSICIVGARHIGSCGWLLPWSSVSLLWLLHCISFCWVCSYMGVSYLLVGVSCLASVSFFTFLVLRFASLSRILLGLSGPVFSLAFLSSCLGVLPWGYIGSLFLVSLFSRCCWLLLWVSLPGSLPCFPVYELVWFSSCWSGIWSARTLFLLVGYCLVLSLVGPGGRFKKAYGLLNLRALKFSPLNKIHIFQCMGTIFCVEFQRYPLKFHTKYLTHTLKGTIFIQHWNFKSS